MYKKKQFLAMCLAGLCSTTTVANVYSVTAMAATAASQTTETISTSTADENAALVENGGTLKITNGKLQKSGDDTNGDNCNFYGINSILLAVGEKSKAYISNSALASDSEGSNAIFATDGATIYSEKNSITTTKGNAHGLDAMDSRRGRPRPDLRRCNDL